MTTVAVTLVGGAASAAGAHTRAKAATNFSSSILEAPELPGIDWRVYAGGEFLEVSNDSVRDIVISGYEGEPYLRIGPDGVFHNRNSPAAYLNAERYGDVAMPPRADPAAPPDWVQVSAAPAHAWHDHRSHWMAQDPPLAVVAAPRRHHMISQWVVPFRYDGTAHEISGTLEWAPGTPWWPWVLLGLLVATPALVGLVAGWEAPRLVRPSAATLAVIAVFNSVHFVDELIAWPAPLLDVLSGLLHTALFIGAGVLGAAVAWHGRYGPFLALGIGSGAVLFHQGLLQLRVLEASQLPTAWPDAVVRLAVAASVGQAIWITAIITRGLRANGAAGGADDPTSTRSLPPLPVVQPRPRSTVVTKHRTAALALILALLLAACGGGDGDASGPDDDAQPAAGEGGDVAIDVVMGDIFYEPQGVEVSSGGMLTVNVNNEGAAEHDFELEDGSGTGIVAPGESGSAELGPFEESTVAFCTVPGHREAGMEFDITVGD